MNIVTTLRVLPRLALLATPEKLLAVWRVCRLRSTGKGDDSQKADAVIRRYGEHTRHIFAQSQAKPSEAIYVVIPCQNEAKHLPALLVALSRNKNVVPIVVNNNSTDTTAAAAKAMGAIVIDQPTGRKMAATQRGIAYVKENFKAKRVLFTDGDGLPVPGWAKTMDDQLKRLDQGSGAAVFGTAIYAFGRSWVIDAALTALGLAYEAMRAARGEAPIARGHNYGVSFDSKGKMVHALQSLNPETFAGTGQQLPDDALILQTLKGVGTSLQYVSSAKTWIVTTNDRFHSLRDVHRLMRPGVTYDDVTSQSYQQEYGKARVRR